VTSTLQIGDVSILYPSLRKWWLGFAESKITEGWCGISYVAEMVEIISLIIHGGLLFDVSKVNNRQRRIRRRII